MKTYEIVVHDNRETYTQAVQGLLERDEAVNCLFLGILGLLKSDPPASLPFMADVRLGTETVAAAVFGDRNLIVTHGPMEVWPDIAMRIRKAGMDIPGVVGPAAQAQSLAEAWARIRGCESRLACDQRIYRLTEVHWPSGVPGRARLIADGDVDIVEKWIEGFYRDAIPWEMPPQERIRQNTIERVSARMTFVWNNGGVPVSMAALSRPTARGISVNFVYTPAAHRGKGYATALVAAVSAEGLRRGSKFCALYTDLANPTSNSIYQKVGYRPVCDSRNYRFSY